jgi:hypothetical protein
MHGSRLILSSAFASLLAAGCLAGPDAESPDDVEGLGEQSQAINNGDGLNLANDYDDPQKHEPMVFINIHRPGQVDSLCSGTLLTSRWLLTAAHCVAGLSTSQLDVTTPFIDLDSPNSAVTAIVIHPSYWGGGQYNQNADIALVQLAQSWHLNVNGFGYQAKFHDGWKPVEGYGVHIYGFGERYYHAPTDFRLREAYVPFVGFVGSDGYQLGLSVSGQNQYWSGGDSGAAAFLDRYDPATNRMQNYLFGVHSTADAYNLTITYDTYIMPYLQWIKDTLRSSINIVTANYGTNCGVTDYWARYRYTQDLFNTCDGQQGTCIYYVDYTHIGDPAPGCAKDYSFSYTCGLEPTVYTSTLPPEAGFWSQAKPRCSAFRGPMMVLHP